jgi:hypothetical protein
MLFRNKLIIAACLASLTACQANPLSPVSVTPSTLREVPALRLNYRYEADVPDPSGDAKKAAEERNAAVQADFDQNRPTEQLYTTIASPDKNRVLAVYSRVGDDSREFRLDMYTPQGVLMRKMTPDTMAVHFPDSIAWAPDSTSVAFVAMVRAAKEEIQSQLPGGGGKPSGTNSNSQTPSSNTNTATNANNDPEANTGVEPVATPAVTVPAPPSNVLTFRTEQIYICNAEGDGLKALTQNEGLIYFYYVWAPDSSALAALALTFREWQYLQYIADSAGEVLVPSGRPRLVEKNGRERRLDDGLTKVHPVWSPDSGKIACAFDSQVRIYDAIGNAPTQAAIPLRNQMLLSAQAYDLEQQRKEFGDNSNASNTPQQQAAVLPDEKTLVSFNPIVNMQWTSPELLYFQTGYVKLLKREADSVRSYLRWHRLVLSPQPIILNPGPTVTQ